MPKSHRVAMRVELTLCVVIVVLCGGEGAARGSFCRDSFDCWTGSCCRDTQGKVVNEMHENPVGSGPNGTCTLQIAQDGEWCDFNCLCAAGMVCFAPVTEFSGQPFICYNATKAKQQIDYWGKCEADPACNHPRYYPRILG